MYCKLRVAREYELLCVEREHDEVRGRKDKDFVTFFFSFLGLQLYEFTPIIMGTEKMRRRNVGGTEMKCTENREQKWTRELYKRMVAAGVTTVADELAQLRSIKEKKGDFETSVKEADRVEKRTKIEEELPEAGRVRANADRFLTGAANEKDDEDKPKKEELKFDTVGRNCELEDELWCLGWRD